jgi:hypothetical protein
MIGSNRQEVDPPGLYPPFPVPEVRRAPILQATWCSLGRYLVMLVQRTPLASLSGVRDTRQRSLQILNGMLVSGHNDPRTPAVLNRLIAAYPERMLQRIADTGFVFRIESASAPIGPSAKTRSIVGAQFAKNLVLPPSVGGVTDLAWGEIVVGGLRNADEAMLSSDAVHEFAHALDYALGRNGSYLSDEPEFQALYVHTRQAHATNPNGVPHFLSPFFAPDSREFFAESALTLRSARGMPSWC